MNKIQGILLATAIIAFTGIYATVMITKAHNEEKDLNSQNTISLSPSFVYYQDQQIYDLIEQMNGLNAKLQLEQLKNFMSKGHLFFTADQIALIINSAFKQTLNAAYAISIMKPYLPPFSTDQAIQIISLVNMSTIPISQIISQVYDLNDENIIKVMNTIPYAYYFRERFLIPQSKISFSQGFRLTTEGQHVGLLIDKTNSMNTIVSQKEDGTNVTRYNLIQQFLYSKLDIFQSFSTFSYNLIGQDLLYTRSLITYGQESNRGFNSYIYNSNVGQGENNLYESIANFLSENDDEMSDLYILTDGIITQGINDVDSFVQLINKINSQRKIKVRINTVSFLQGGEETIQQRQQSYKILQALSDATRGTFIKFVPLKQ